MAITKAQAKAVAKYEKENYDRVLVRLPKGTKEKIKKYTDSINGFIVSAVNEKLKIEENNAFMGSIEDPFT